MISTSMWSYAVQVGYPLPTFPAENTYHYCPCVDPPTSLSIRQSHCSRHLECLEHPLLHIARYPISYSFLGNHIMVRIAPLQCIRILSILQVDGGSLVDVLSLVQIHLDRSHCPLSLTLLCHSNSLSNCPTSILSTRHTVLDPHSSRSAVGWVESTTSSPCQASEELMPTPSIRYLAPTSLHLEAHTSLPT